MKLPKPQQLPSGAWRIHVQVNGKRVAKTFPTESEALYWAAGIKTEEKEYKENPKRLLLRDAYDRYIAMKDGVLSPTTITGYRRLSRNTFQSLMDKDINTLTNEEIQIAISRMAKEKSPKYVSNAQGLLSAVLKVYRPDFVLRVTLPQKQKHLQRALTNDEIASIIHAVKGTDIELPVLMALWLGMRLSEILGARYEDVRDHRLHVSRALVLTENNTYVEKATKTSAGDRYIPLPQYIEDKMAGKTGPVTTLSGQAIYKRFSRLLEKTGIPHCRFHDLRHANASVMIQAGVEARYAQARGGWESEYMYKQVYGYTVTTKLDADAAKIDTFITALLDKSAHENVHENQKTL